MFWHQKSRNNWLRCGDRNTKFFHLSTMIRRRRNKIEGLRDVNGDWVDDKFGLKRIACDYFISLFSYKNASFDYTSLPALFPTIDDISRENMCKGISEEEVKSSLFDIGGLKAPGPDGFPAVFFQNQWPLCKVDLVNMVTNSFRLGHFPFELNQTLIALIPKIPSPLEMANFRPISLCNTAYKVISKIIVSRLRGVMADLVGPNQVAFIPGRQIQDNIVVAQEVLHKFRVSKSKKGFLAWKIDLAKAYDKIQWDFIENVLLEVGLTKHFVDLIMFCVRSVNYRVVLNGEISDAFSPGCGIRQGDPISPYLFILCMEKLSHLIVDCVNKGSWKPIAVSRGGPLISHLFFADDLILFGHATFQQAESMKLCLDRFCGSSGQEVSFSKSRVFCSSLVRDGDARALASICGSPITKDLGKYLGVPLLHSRITKHTYCEILEKTQKRLAYWKSATLSMAGRVTLIKAVTAAIPVYSMQTIKLPNDLCCRLDKVNRDFLWGHTVDKKTVHLVNWRTVCTPKGNGGLGIKSTKLMNQSLLAKAGWRILQGDKGVWSQLLTCKYLNNANLLTPGDSDKPVCSNTWKGIKFGAKLLSSGINWRIGNGNSVHFWTDVWASDCGSLANHAAVALNDTLLSEKVKDYVVEAGWNLRKLATVLPWNIIHKITKIHIGNIPDKIIWGGCSKGNFSVKTAYNLMLDSDSPPWQWNFIWKLKLPPKVLTFLWSLLHGKILTNDHRRARCLTTDSSCPRCFSGLESIDHLLRGCKSSVGIWNQVCTGFSSSTTFSDSFISWIYANLKNTTIIVGDAPWYMVFALTVWYIWKWRCCKVFDTNFVIPVNSHIPIFMYVKEWWNCMGTGGNFKEPSLRLISWIPPVEGCVKLNVDGSLRASDSSITAAGVLRNHDICWKGGFIIKIGMGNILEAELWGLYEGLKFAWASGFKSIVVESDSRDVVSLVNTGPCLNHPCFNLADACCSLLKANWACSIVHIFREANRLADVLAGMGHDLALGVHTLETIPPQAALIFEDDRRNLAMARLVPD
ncbi:hypothetical protein ACOSQ4_000119 [Xanthoceras sorbifolium]